jgi:hypothetical protein
MGVASKMVESCMAELGYTRRRRMGVWGLYESCCLGLFVIGDGADKRMLGLGVVWALGFRSWVTVSVLRGKGRALAQLCSTVHIMCFRDGQVYSRVYTFFLWSVSPACSLHCPGTRHRPVSVGPSTAVRSLLLRLAVTAQARQQPNLPQLIYRLLRSFLSVTSAGDASLTNVQLSSAVVSFSSCCDTPRSASTSISAPAELLSTLPVSISRDDILSHGEPEPQEVGAPGSGIAPRAVYRRGRRCAKG